MIETELRRNHKLFSMVLPNSKAEISDQGSRQGRGGPQPHELNLGKALGRILLKSLC